ncbi:MAG: RidA family protein [Alphaproteobacteria bacterium]
MARQRVSSGSAFEKILGYSRAVRDGNWVFHAGTTGFDYKRHTISLDVIDQTKQMLANMEWGLKEAGASFDDVVRINLYMTDHRDFERVARIIQKKIGRARPAATMITATFADPRILVEMDATALIQEKTKRPAARPKRPKRRARR